ncbi:MerR family transcriptional regulator [Streptosporangium sp. LJ11]|uniref:MerR family transcriptional regulator n=1 Tax=Streptosporangium sp. LJ11 TaxID=3436927 RepID=UPI003F7AAF5E
MSDSAEFYTIGRLARRTGLPVHTIRFWSDSGVVPPTGRSDGGYRLYDAAAVARIDAGLDLRRLVLERAGRALADGVTPESAEGWRVLGRIIGPRLPPAERAGLRDRLRMLADAQVERYWELLGVLNGREPSPSVIPAFDWVITALGAHR